jgi:D-xylose transport system permease protein
VSTLSLRDFSLAIALAAIWTFFGLVSPNFFDSRNLSMLAIELSITAILALGMLIVLLPGLIDLSAGSGVGLLGGIAAVLVFRFDFSAPAAMLVAFVLGLAAWALMGTLIVRQRVPAFIITLGGLLVYRGLFWLVIENATVPVSHGNVVNLYALLTTYFLPAWAGFGLAALFCAGRIWARLRDRASRQRHGLPLEDRETFFLASFVECQLVVLVTIVLHGFRGVPLPVVLLALVALFTHVLTRHTAFGRQLYAIGGNEEAARLSGIPIQRTVITAYLLLGGLVALTGFMQTAYSGASTTTVGNLMELDAIAACVIGGTSLSGGRGTVMGALFGSLIMASLLNGMTLMAVAPELKFIARGAVLVLAVWMDVSLARRAGATA